MNLRSSPAKLTVRSPECFLLYFFEEHRWYSCGLTACRSAASGVSSCFESAQRARAARRLQRSLDGRLLPILRLLS
jgi:hypothetical protein